MLGAFSAFPLVALAGQKINFLTSLVPFLSLENLSSRNCTAVTV